MDYTNLFIELLKLSPFVATLFGFLYTVWNTMQKTNSALIATMKEHSTVQLLMQKDSIMAQNGAAEANRQLAATITDLRLHLTASNEDLIDEVRDLNRQRLKGRAVSHKSVPAPAPNA